MTTIDQDKEYSELQKARRIQGYLGTMIMYGEQYLEAHNKKLDEITKSWCIENYQRFKRFAQEEGADVSKYPETLEELTN